MVASDATSAKPRGGFGLVSRRRGGQSDAETKRAKDATPQMTPSSSLASTEDEPGTFAYKHQEADSASSLGSLIDEVADFVEPERVPEKIPHKATGAPPLARDDSGSAIFPHPAPSRLPAPR